MEKSISNQIISYINNLPGCMAYKRLSNGSSSTNGYPDITGSLGIIIHANNLLDNLLIGVRLEIETKQPGETPSQLQYNRLRLYRSMGCVAFWTDNLLDCQAKLELWQKVLTNKAKHPGFEDLIDNNKNKFVCPDLENKKAGKGASLPGSVRWVA